MKLLCLKSNDTDAGALFRPFALKMEEQGMPSIVINIFKCYFSQLVYGAQGKLLEKDISPLTDDDVRTYESLEEYRELGESSIGKAVIIKLNGGLGTSMGLEKAKSLIKVKDGYSFLELIFRQVEALRKKYGRDIPLCFMNSFKTHLDTMMLAEGFQNPKGVPLAFVQHRYPKILENSNLPAVWPKNPELEWNPPGHGDFYTAIVTSGLLTKLLKNGHTHAFVSNSDNLGAAMDERILGYMIKENLPFVMEVARRTQADKKGGHLARLNQTGALILREVAQCPENEMDEFSNIEKHRFFNTNSLWVDLRELERVFVEHRMMPLDMILNPKTLDPRDPNSPAVIQVETAMGAAISNFANAKAVVVPRDRFAPVKTTSDLCLVMSDCYIRSEGEVVVRNPERAGPLPLVSLDQAFYKKIDAFNARFPEGVPSLIQADSFEVQGDVRFEAGVVCKGPVKVVNRYEGQAVIAAGTELSGTHIV